MSLSHDQLIRYARHLTLPEVGLAGQERLAAARVLIVGAGGLGSPAALYLAAAGIGTIGLVEFDRVDLTNLQRQILHRTPDVGRAKLESARERIEALNPTVRVVGHATRLRSDNALDIVAGYDLILDGSDNFPTRYLVNDAAILSGKPFVYGSILRFEGQVSVFGVSGGPCYRCLFSEPPPPDLVPNCAEAGVLGVLPGVVGTLQATEVIKLILGIGAPLVGRLLLYDGLSARTREITVRRDPACAVCGDQPTVRSLIDYDTFCGVAGGEPRSVEIAPLELAQLRRLGARVDLVDIREPWEVEIVRLDGARLIPFAELPARLGELDAEAEVVAICHRGQRSLVAQQVLEGAGFRARSLAGGIDAWAAAVDPGLARY